MTKTRHKTAEQWAAVIPAAVVAGSTAQAENVLQMALDDIALLDADLNLFRGKYRAMLKLISRARDQLVHVTDSIEDEGDRKYFGSTNDADALLDLYHEMMSWVWDDMDKTNRMQSDPYADLRAARSDIATKDAEIARLENAKADLLVSLKALYDLSSGGGTIDPDNEATKIALTNAAVLMALETPIDPAGGMPVEVE